MSRAGALRTDAHERGFVADASDEARWTDLALIGAVPALLLVVYALPRSTLEGLVLDTTSPSLVTAYVSHFVHLDGFHLLGNLTVYVPAAAVGYLLCILSGRRGLFRIGFVTLLLAFPVALSSMQLVFPRPRLIFGFSGINAGFAGMACFAFVGYLRTNVTPRAEDRYAPTLLFFVMGLIALVALPTDAFRFEIGALSFSLAAVYVGTALYRQGVPAADDVRAAVNRPGYFETAGAGFGLIVGYPFVAFQDAVVPGGSVLDVYVHLLGASLAFIVLFAYVFVIEAEES